MPHCSSVRSACAMHNYCPYFFKLPCLLLINSFCSRSYAVNATSYPGMQPVLSDHYDVGCPLATEEQVNGLYGGNVDALTDMYFDGIQKVGIRVNCYVLFYTLNVSFLVLIATHNKINRSVRY